MKQNKTVHWFIPLSLVCLMGVSAWAQEGPCGLSSIEPRRDLIYPPIAKAAHVEGSVIALVSFSQTGVVSTLRILSGPKLLVGSAEEFMKSFKVNSYGGSRECPIVVSFHMAGPSQECKGDVQANKTSFNVIDRQHYEVRGTIPCFVVMRDPAGHMIRKKPFLIF